MASRLPDAILIQKFNTFRRITVSPCSNLQNCTIYNHVLQNSCYVLCVINSKMVTSYQWHLKLPHHSEHTCGLASTNKQKKESRRFEEERKPNRDTETQGTVLACATIILIDRFEICVVHSNHQQFINSFITNQNINDTLFTPKHNPTRAEIRNIRSSVEKVDIVRKVSLYKIHTSDSWIYALKSKAWLVLCFMQMVTKTKLYSNTKKHIRRTREGYIVSKPDT